MPCLTVASPVLVSTTHEDAAGIGTAMAPRANAGCCEPLRYRLASPSQQVRCLRTIAAAHSRDRRRTETQLRKPVSGAEPAPRPPVVGDHLRLSRSRCRLRSRRPTRRRRWHLLVVVADVFAVSAHVFGCHG